MVDDAGACLRVYGDAHDDLQTASKRIRRVLFNYLRRTMNACLSVFGFCRDIHPPRNRERERQRQRQTERERETEKKSGGREKESGDACKLFT